jgi:hypothetical protein
MPDFTKKQSELVFLLLANFRQNFDLKNMISTYTKNFSPKKWLDLARFWEKRISKLLDFYFYDKFQR